MIRTAILVDGGFYQKRANHYYGYQNPAQRAKELVDYCQNHLKDDGYGEKSLYRIFYYDCPPSTAKVYHPLLKTNIDLSKSDKYTWMNDFFESLCKKRKVALRKGETLESSANFIIKPEKVMQLCNNTITIADLTKNDFTLDIKQKGVDMRIGLDIASLAQKRLVDQIVLIAGDSDFVPAAKHARREGIDVILDPMWQTIKQSLNEHIDGLKTYMPKVKPTKRDVSDNET